MAKKKRPLRKVGTHVQRISRYYAMVEAGKSRAEIAKALKLSEPGLYVWQERMAEIGLRMPKPLPPTAWSLFKPTFPLTFSFDVNCLLLTEEATAMA